MRGLETIDGGHSVVVRLYYSLSIFLQATIRTIQLGYHVVCRINLSRKALNSITMGAVLLLSGLDSDRFPPVEIICTVDEKARPVKRAAMKKKWEALIGTDRKSLCLFRPLNVLLIIKLPPFSFPIDAEALHQSRTGKNSPCSHFIFFRRPSVRSFISPCDLVISLLDTLISSQYVHRRISCYIFMMPHFRHP